MPPRAVPILLPPLADGVRSARWVLPVATQPIAHGGVVYDGGDVDEFTNVPPAACDLPTHAILPGLVNAHTHLDLSGFAAPIAAGQGLPEWIPKVVQSRAASPADAVARGIDESLSQGCLAAGDVCVAEGDDVGEASDAHHKRSPFERRRFLETLSLDPAKWDAAVDRASAFLARDPTHGLSPHATYSVPLPLLRRLVDAAIAAEGDRGVMMHVAEHPAERDLLRRGEGPFRKMLDALGVWRADAFGGGSIADVLAELLRSTRPLVAHGNHLTEAEIGQLAAHGNATVVWCPRTHAHFGQPRHPVAELLAAGVRVAIGTDSRASSPDLSVWSEAVFAARSRPDLDGHEIVRMVTQSAAAALGLNGYGTIRPGTSQPLVAVPLAKPDAADWQTALFG